MKDFICKKCGNTTYIVQEKSNGTGVATGLYCAKCGTWHKWLNKQEKILYTTHSEDIDKDKEIARLTAENADLHARLEKAVETPVKIGDTIYEILVSVHREWIVNAIKIFETGIKIDAQEKSSGAHWYFDLNDYNETWFTNRAKAEACLAELKGGEEE